MNLRQWEMRFEIPEQLSENVEPSQHPLPRWRVGGVPELEKRKEVVDVSDAQGFWNARNVEI